MVLEEAEEQVLLEQMVILVHLHPQGLLVPVELVLLQQ
jgi:hypothetical protein